MNQTAPAMLLRRIPPLRACFALAVLMFSALATFAQTPPPTTTPTNCSSFTELVTLIGVSRNITFDCDGTINFENPIVIESDTTLDGTDGNVTLSGNDVTGM